MTGNKEMCKEIMLKYFGPATAKLVDNMDEKEAVSKCRLKVLMIYGPDQAKEFDSIK